MGYRFTLSSIAKEEIKEEVIFNVDTMIAFRSQFSSKADFHVEFHKDTDLGVSANVFERERDDFVIDEDDISFSCFVSKNLMDDFTAALSDDDFITNRLKLDTRFLPLFKKDVKQFKELVKRVNFDTHYLIMSYV